MSRILSGVFRATKCARFRGSDPAPADLRRRFAYIGEAVEWMDERGHTPARPLHCRRLF